MKEIYIYYYNNTQHTFHNQSKSYAPLHIHRRMRIQDIYIINKLKRFYKRNTFFVVVVVILYIYLLHSEYLQCESYVDMNENNGTRSTLTISLLPFSSFPIFLLLLESTKRRRLLFFIFSVCVCVSVV